MRGQSGVLPRFANGKRQLVVVDDCRHRCLVSIDHHTFDRGGAEPTGKKDGFVFAPGHDVDPLVAQFPNDRLDPGAFHPHAGADRIDAGVVRIHRDFCSLSRFAGDGPDFNDTLVDFRDLELKQLHQKLRMRSGEDDLRPLRRAENVDQIGAYRVSLAVPLLANLLLERNDRLRAPQVYQNIAVADLLDGAADDFADSILIVLVDLLALGFPHPLDKDLLGGLNGITAEIGKPEQLPDFPVDFDAGFDLAGCRKSDLKGRILDLLVLDDRLCGNDLDIAGVDIDIHLDVVRRAEPPLGCGEQPDFQGFDHERPVNVFFLGNLAQRLKDFVVQKDISSKFEMEVGFSYVGGRDDLNPAVDIEYQFGPVVSREVTNQHASAIQYDLNGPADGSLVVPIGLERPVESGRRNLKDIAPADRIVSIQNISDPAAEARAFINGNAVCSIHVDAQRPVPGTARELQIDQVRTLVLQIGRDELFDCFLNRRIVHKPEMQL